MLEQLDLTKGKAGMANGEGVRIGWGALITTIVVILSGVIGYNYSLDKDLDLRLNLLQKEKLDKTDYYAAHVALEGELRNWAKDVTTSMKELQSLFLEHVKEDRNTYVRKP